jgi:hypothetical protein
MQLIAESYSTYNGSVALCALVLLVSICNSIYKQICCSVCFSIISFYL